MILGFPLGEWLDNGYWIANHRLDMTPKEQYRHNLSYGYNCEIPDFMKENYMEEG